MCLRAVSLVPKFVNRFPEPFVLSAFISHFSKVLHSLIVYWKKKKINFILCHTQECCNSCTIVKRLNLFLSIIHPCLQHKNSGSVFKQASLSPLFSASRPADLEYNFRQVLVWEGLDHCQPQKDQLELGMGGSFVLSRLPPNDWRKLYKSLLLYPSQRQLEISLEAKQETILTRKL